MAKAKRVMPISDQTIRALGDEQLGDLLQRVVGECHRRGDAARAALRATLTAALTTSGLDDDERARVQDEAARREAERLREEEASRIAAVAAEQVRREREAEKARHEEDKARRQNERLRTLAQRARGLIGHDEADFVVQVWSRVGERRVYIGQGYGYTWVEYYHTGSARILPGTIKFPWTVDRPLAAHLGCTREEAQGRIKVFCAELCEEWESLRLEVTEANAPRDPACRVKRWVLRHNISGNFLGQSRGVHWPVLTGLRDATKYRSRKEAEAALAARAEGGKNPDEYTAVERQVWLAYPPREAD